MRNCRSGIVYYVKVFSLSELLQVWSYWLLAAYFGLASIVSFRARQRRRAGIEDSARTADTLEYAVISIYHVALTVRSNTISISVLHYTCVQLCIRLEVQTGVSDSISCTDSVLIATDASASIELCLGISHALYEAARKVFCKKSDCRHSKGAEG